VLIGRASFGNPFVFYPTDEGNEGGLDKLDRRHHLIEIALEHVRLYHQTFSRYERYWFHPMRKHLGWYVKDLHSARHVRGRLVQTNSPQDAEALLREYGMVQ
jgi:tRNA-dihydrouridine synthase B